MQLPDMNKRKKLTHATSVSYKQEQTEDSKTFFIYNIVSIVTSPSKKVDQNKVNAIKDLLQCSMSSSYCRTKMASTKRGHLIDQVQNTELKWSIKPCIVREKKVSKALRQKSVEWIIKNSNLRESPTSRDTLLFTDAESVVKQRVTKLLLVC